MPTGYSLPLSPRGNASLVQAPPWHYVGDVTVIEFWADPAAVAENLPQGFEPLADDPGKAALLFIDWQSRSEEGRELLDPIRSQYREVLLVLNGMLDGEPVTTVPYIWVDQDFALVRGWIQGFPKKLGQIHITRDYGMNSSAESQVFAASVTTSGRRIAYGTVDLGHPVVEKPSHGSAPRVNVRHFPRLESGRHGDPAVYELVQVVNRDVSSSPIKGGAATLEFFPSDVDNIADFGPVRVGNGYRYTLAFTVDDHIVRKTFTK